MLMNAHASVAQKKTCDEDDPHHHPGLKHRPVLRRLVPHNAPPVFHPNGLEMLGDLPPP